MQRDLQAVGDKKEKDSAVTMYSPDELKKIIKKLQDTAIVMDVVDNGIKRSHIVYHHKVGAVDQSLDVISCMVILSDACAGLITVL